MKGFVVIPRRGNEQKDRNYCRNFAVTLVLLFLTLFWMPLTVFAASLPTPDLQKAIYTLQELPITGSLASTKLFWQVDNGYADGKIDGFIVYRNNTLWKVVSEREARTVQDGKYGYEATDKYYKWDRNQNKTVTYTIRAFQGDNYSDYSNGKTVRIVEEDTIGPTSPTDLKVLELKGNTLKIGWSGSLDDQVSTLGALKDRILGKKPETNLDYQVFINGKLIGTKVKEDEYTIGLLIPEKTYNISVLALDAKGNPSKLSENLTVTMPKTKNGLINSTNRSNLSEGDIFNIGSNSLFDLLTPVKLSGLNNTTVLTKPNSSKNTVSISKNSISFLKGITSNFSNTITQTKNSLVTSNYALNWLDEKIEDGLSVIINHLKL